VNKSDQLKLEIITKFIAKIIDINLASQVLNVSKRTIFRYQKKFLENRARFLVHGNKLRQYQNKFPEKIKDDIISLLAKKYFDYSIKHAHEKLISNEQLIKVPSYRTLLRWSHEKKFIKKLIRKKRTPKARKRMPKTGVMLQLDGSTHQWFGKKKSTLIAAIDDANNEVP